MPQSLVPEGPVYRDDAAALVEKRAELLAEREPEVRHARSLLGVIARRRARAVAAIAALPWFAAYQTMLVVAPSALATSHGATWLARGFVLAAPVSVAVALVVVRLSAARSLRRLDALVTLTGDVRADLDRLRAPLDTAQLTATVTRLARPSFLAPLFAVCSAPALLLVHVRLELVAARPLQFFLLETGLHERRMTPAESLATFAGGSAVSVTLASVAFAIAVTRFVTKELLPQAKRDTGATVASFFGGVMLGAMLAQSSAENFGESALAVGLSYGAIALGIAAGIFGTRALFAWARRTHSSEQPR